MSRITIYCSVSLLCIGTLAVSSSAWSQEQSKAKVYVYRYRQFVGAALKPSVYCDDVQLARMTNGRYFVVSLPSGTHAFRADDGQAGVQLDVKPGEQYYIRVEVVPGMLKGHGRLVLVQKEQGSFEIARLKPLNTGKIKESARAAAPEVTVR